MLSALAVPGERLPTLHRSWRYEGALGALVVLSIVGVETTLLPGQEGQTGLIHARVQVGHEPVDVLATWLGLSHAERACQMKAALTWLRALTPGSPGEYLSPGLPLF